MNKKYDGCKVEGCTEKHRRNGYCTNHSQKAIRGTINNYPQSKLCSHPGCFAKSYCNNLCNKHYRRKIKNLPMNMEEGTKNHYIRGELDFKHANKDSWSLAVRQFFGDKCMICGWEESSCDAHHIHAKSKGGENTLQNAIILCPNHHRLANIGKLVPEYLLDITLKSIELNQEEL
jgi:hypothetical protein